MHAVVLLSCCVAFHGATLRMACANIDPARELGCTLQLCDGWEREAYEHIHTGRDWDAVDAAMRAAALSGVPLPGDTAMDLPSGLPGPPPSRGGVRLKERHTWALTIAYYGPAFSSFTWQKDAPETTVLGILQVAIQPLLAGRHQIVLANAGRTDAGVSATGQLITFYSWEPIDPEALRIAVDSAAPGALRMRAAQLVPRSFHATFAAAWRRYVYILPCRERGSGDTGGGGGDDPTAEQVNAQLARLVGRPLDYAALGRGVPKGKNTVTTLLHASASAMTLPAGAQRSGTASAMRIDVTGDRFIRRQIRCLVATAVLAARFNPGDDGTLLRMATCGDQLQSAPAAPALGLCFAGVGY
jgi:tRNA pseudouridine(38-40) synthase